jgi:glycosyltransferase involved in cell wall biosynthesis
LAIEQAKDPIEISVVVPVYNSEGSLRPLVERIGAALSTRSFEILLVNDGSADRSWNVIREICSGNRSVRGFNMMRNYGQHNAVLAGIRAARGSISVTIDDDLQHPPEEIPKLVAELSRGCDVVYGTPRRAPHSVFRNLSSWITKLVLQKAIGAETARRVSAFRAFRTSLRGAFDQYQSAFVSIDVLLTWGTRRFGSVEVEHRPREIGESNYTLRTLLGHAMTMMTGFSTLPLRVATILGLTVTFFGFCVLGFVLATYFMRPDGVPGFPFLASIIAIFSGAQLFALGIMGEYLARMHVRLMERPAFVIAESLDGLQS